jgi:hypothetical protein
VIFGEDHVVQVQEPVVLNALGEVEDDMDPQFVANLVEVIQHAAQAGANKASVALSTSPSAPESPKHTTTPRHSHRKRR